MTDKAFGLFLVFVLLVWLVMVGLAIWAIINIVPALVQFLTR